MNNNQTIEFVNQQQSCSNSDQEDYQLLQGPLDQSFTNSFAQKLSNMNQACHKSIRTLNTLAMNAAYNARHSFCPFIQRQPVRLVHQQQFAYLLGKKYSSDTNAQFQCAFHQIMWITYRTQRQDKASDAGWGCMIRVCQMVLAQALKRYSKRLHASEIFKLFSSPDGIFNIDRICQQGDIFQRWTSSSQILGILSEILKKQNTIRLFLDLFNSSVCSDDLKAPEEYPMLLALANRLGEKSIQQKYHDHILSLLENKRSVGIIGGIGGQAIYIAGYHERSLIILDPHYVQSEEAGLNIHFKDTPRGIPIASIGPSLTFCFLFETREQHQEWLEDVAELNYFYYPNTVIQMDEQACKVVYASRHPKKDLESDDDFQVL